MNCKDCKFYCYFLGIKPFGNVAEIFGNGNYLWCDIQVEKKHIARSYPSFRSFDEAHIQMASDCHYFSWNP